VDQVDDMAKILSRIDREKVKEALLQNLEIAAAHLDLEGFAFVKLTRTGLQACFSADVTSQVLKGEEPACGKLTTKEISKTFWSKPAMFKDWKV
jgi:hypothetical protein